jgi:hypothetical protein
MGHIVELVQKLEDRDARDWYARRAAPGLGYSYRPT